MSQIRVAACLPASSCKLCNPHGAHHQQALASISGPWQARQPCLARLKTPTMLMQRRQHVSALLSGVRGCCREALVPSDCTALSRTPLTQKHKPQRVPPPSPVDQLQAGKHLCGVRPLVPGHQLPQCPPGLLTGGRQVSLPLHAELGPRIAPIRGIGGLHCGIIGLSSLALGLFKLCGW